MGWMTPCNCHCKKGTICNLRAFSAATGAELWQILDFQPIGTTTSGSVYGYRWKDATGFDGRYLHHHELDATNGPAAYTNRLQNKGVQTNPTIFKVASADCLRIDIDGSENLVMADATYFSFIPDGGGNYSLTGTAKGHRLYEHSFFQMHNASADGFISRPPEQRVTITDPHKAVTNHKIRIYPQFILKPGANPPMWVMKAGTTVVKFSQYATASVVQAAIASYPQVASVTVTGGPTCLEILDIDVTFTTTSGQIDWLVLEFAQKGLSSLTTGFELWELSTHKPLAPDWAAAYTSFSTFVLDGSNAISQGALSGTSTFRGHSIGGRSGSAPFYAAVTQLWAKDPFAGLTNTAEKQEISGAPAVVPITKRISAFTGGKVAVCANACAAPGATIYTTHFVLSAADGSTLDTGMSGFLAETNLKFASSGYFATGARKERLPLRGVTGTNTLLTAQHAEPGFVELYGPAVDQETIRETDRSIVAFDLMAVGTNIAGNHQIRLPGTGTGFSVSPIMGTNSGITPYQLTGQWLAQTEVLPSDTFYGFSSYRKDTFHRMSNSFRFEPGVEWRYVHGASGSPYTVWKATPWFPHSVSISDVETALNAWYGFVPPGTHAVEDRIVRVNPFGLGAHADDSPALPTFQRISEIWIYRNFLSTPTPGAPLAPQSINVLVIEWRNNFSTVTKQIVGLSPTTGTIQWQREAAEDLTTTGTEQLSAMTAVGDTFVGYLIAKKDVHYPAYNKAGVEI